MGRQAPRDSFSSASHTRAKGRIAERAAVGWLKCEGYVLIETNYAIRAGEIDAIALDGETLCFVEVKARHTADFGPAIGAVTLRKQLRIVRAATGYLVSHDWDGPCRFDVLGMDMKDTGWEFTLIRDAFSAA